MSGFQTLAVPVAVWLSANSPDRTSQKLPDFLRPAPGAHDKKYVYLSGANVDLPILIAILISLGAFVFGLLSIVTQARSIKLLKTRSHVPGDEARYLKGRHRRRLFSGSILVVIGLMIAGSYLSGMEKKASDGRVAFNQKPVNEGGDKATPEEKQFFRFWSGYWIVIVSLLGIVVMIASADAWATRKYGLAMLRELRDEHKARLARDLAVFKQQKTDRFGNRFAGGSGA
jgi:hypothetical protein